MHQLSDYDDPPAESSGEAGVHPLSQINNPSRAAQYAEYPPEPEAQENKLKACFYTLFPFFNLRTFTFFMLILELTVFILTAIISSTQDESFACGVYHLGGCYPPDIRYRGHLHRLFFPIFLHFTIWHILWNVLAQMFMGFSTEHLFRLKDTIILFFTSGIYGNCMSAATHGDVLSAGASTSIMGVLGFQAIAFWANYRKLGPNKKQFLVLYAIIFMLILLNSIFDANNSVDIYGHLGTIYIYIRGFNQWTILYYISIPV